MSNNQRARRPRRAERLDARATFLLLGSFLAVFALARLATLEYPSGGRNAALLMAAVGVILGMLGVAKAIGRRDPFHPAAFPVAYMAFALIGSAIYGVTHGFGGAFMPPELITPRVMAAITLFVLGLAVSPLLAKAKVVRGQQTAALEYPMLLIAGHALLAVATALRVQRLLTEGAGSYVMTADGGGSTVSIISGILPLIGVAMLVLANRSNETLQIGGVAVGLLALWSGASLLIGTRDEILGPLILVAWAHHARGARMGWTKLSIFGGVAFVILALVGVWRNEAADRSASIGQILLRPVASATNTTALTVEAVPQWSDYLNGMSYWTSLRSLPLTAGWRERLGIPETAALAFPDMIGYSARSGLGYSPSAEAYWNFGLWGTFLIPGAFGLFLVWAYRRAVPWPHSPLSLLYPLVLARIPLTARADSFQQLKGLAYVLVLLGTVWAVDKTIHQARATSRRQRNRPRASRRTRG